MDQAELWCHTYGYLKSMALHSAVKLGIPDAVHRCGGAASLPDLLAALSIPPNKRPYLARLMKILAAVGIFIAEDVPAAGDGVTTASCVYRLTPVSRLLVDDVGINGSACLSRFVLAAAPLQLVASVRLHQWLQREDEATAETPFMMAHGEGFYGLASHDVKFNAVFNKGMGSDSQFLAQLGVRECGEVFTGITSLVDVGGGNGTTARTIAEAFPHVKCSVLDLPHVIDGISAHDMVEFVAGDMMEFIPPADAVLLKSVLHNWSDEDCVKVLRRCREAIVQGARTRKVLIIDTGKEREEQNWHKIFVEAGFSRYKIQPVLGVRSVIEVYL